MKCVKLYMTVDGEVFPSKERARRYENDLLCQRLEKLLLAHKNDDRETTTRYLRQVLEVIEYE